MRDRAMSQEAKDLFEKSALKARNAYIAMAKQRSADLPKDLLDAIAAAKAAGKDPSPEILARFAEETDKARPPVMILAEAVSGPYEAIILAELPKFYGVCVVSRTTGEAQECIVARAQGQDPINPGMRNHELLNAMMINYAELGLGTSLMSLELADLNRVVDQMFKIIDLIKP